MLNHLTILRAVAVVLVLAFHFDNQLLISGYIGVDIFFVISGYLITMISLKRVENLKSLRQFYIKRIMRIYPALLFMSFSVIFVLSLIEYLELESLKMIRDTIFGTSNITAQRINSDYFADNNNNYLLHLWSIAIELQFYLFFPLLMLYNKIKNNITPVLALFSIMSLSILLFEQNYYSSLGRMFAFSAGALAYLYTDKVKPKNYLFFLSLVLLIVLSTMDLNVQTYPNYSNVIVVFFTVSAILFGQIGAEKRYRLFIFLGLISYSLYLWHYPLFLFFIHLNVDVNVLSIFILLFILVSLSLFSYLVIEKKFVLRNYGNWTILFILIPQIILVFTIYYIKTSSFNFAIVNSIYEKITLNPLLYHSELANLNVTNTYAGCLDNKDELLTECSSTKINSATKRAIVMGNSFVHSGGLVFLDKVTAHYNIKSDFFYQIGKQRTNEKLFASIKKGKYDYLIIYYPWLKIKRQDIIQYYKDISNYVHIVFVKGPHFNMDINQKQAFRFNNLFIKDDEQAFECNIQKPYTSKEGYSIIDSVLDELGAKSISIYDLQKDENENYMCSNKNISLFKDSFHMNDYAGKLFSQRFIKDDLGKGIFDDYNAPHFSN